MLVGLLLKKPAIQLENLNTRLDDSKHSQIGYVSKIRELFHNVLLNARRHLQNMNVLHKVVDIGTASTHCDTVYSPVEHMQWYCRARLDLKVQVGSWQKRRLPYDTSGKRTAPCRIQNIVKSCHPKKSALCEASRIWFLLFPRLLRNDFDLHCAVPMHGTAFDPVVKP